MSLQVNEWPEIEKDYRSRIEQERKAAIAEGENQIRAVASDLSEIERRERELHIHIKEEYDARLREYTMTYLEKVLCSNPDDSVRNISLELAAERHVLSKVFTKYTHVTTDDERLPDIVPRAVIEYKDAILEWQIQQLNRQIKNAFAESKNETECLVLMERLNELHTLRRDMATYLGERIILPR